MSAIIMPLKTGITEVDKKEPIVIVNKLSIKYEGEKVKKDDFKSIIHKSLRFGRKNKCEAFWALREVSFTGYAGDVIGIIGANGAGKSTLCLALLGLLKPDEGNVQVKGEATSLLSLGTGFNKELSGRDNILLNGMMFGYTRKDIKKLSPYIEEFSGLGNFLDQPIKHYSSGMKARLGFSIAASLNPDVLVIDEVLGAGDLEFKERAVERMQQLVAKSKLVIVVSHDLDFIKENATKVIWIEEGRLAASGRTESVIEQYTKKYTIKTKIKKKVMKLVKTSTATIGNNTIKAENLGIKFKLSSKTFWALKDVTFTAKDKEIIGVIGPNGAGKTTLCRTLAGIYQPDEGKLSVKGEISALLSFNVGFNDQLSGVDNIYLNGMMMGVSKKELNKLVNNVVEFAGLEKFIHKPVKVYSSGMKVRLGFSIAAMLKPDIFIVDEALSAGDMGFREKAASRMQEMISEAKTVILVTHGLGLVVKLCTRVILLKLGKVFFEGDPQDAIKRYEEIF
jgi:teichoic acid transport system ATP-binding protein